MEDIIIEKNKVDKTNDIVYCHLKFKAEKLNNSEKLAKQIITANQYFINKKNIDFYKVTISFGPSGDDFVKNLSTLLFKYYL